MRRSAESLWVDNKMISCLARLRYLAGKITVVAVVLALCAATAVTAGWRSFAAYRSLAAEPVRSVRFVLEPISPESAGVDFGPIEAALARARTNSAGDILIDANTASALAAAAATLPATVSTQAMARVQFLVRKEFPGKSGAQLAALLRDYHRYKDIESRTLGPPPAHADLATAIARFHETVALRQRYFGKMRAQALFGKQQALAAYLLELRRIEADTSLTDAERRKRQQTLRKDYDARNRADAE